MNIAVYPVLFPLMTGIISVFFGNHRRLRRWIVAF